MTESNNLPLDGLDDGGPPQRSDADAGKGHDDAAPDTGERPGCPDQPLAKGLRIRELALYQTVKIPLFQDGTWLDASNRSAVIVGGKQGVLRALVDVTPEYERHAVRAVLRLKDGDTIGELSDLKTIDGDSTEAELGSSFNFMIKAGQLGAGTELSVSLEETTCKAEPGYPEEARVPVAGGYQVLQAADIDKLRLVLVPIEYNGRAPELPIDKVEEMRRTLLAYYPVPDVDLQVRKPLVWTNPVDADGTGWTELLLEVARERQQDNVRSDVYYIGVVQPQETMQTFCERGGCILGVGMQAVRRNSAQQVALAAGFPDQLTYESIVHELGHAHGRFHSPCSSGDELRGVDLNYPLKNGAVESWGWDFRTKALVASAGHMDIMGYCEPYWISTYTYQGLADRSLEVNGDAFIKGGGAGITFDSLILYADGRTRWGAQSEAGLLATNTEPGEALDAQGNVVGTFRVQRVPLSHVSNEIAYVPRPQAGWASIRLHDRVIKLADVLPALSADKRR